MKIKNLKLKIILVILISLVLSLTSVSIVLADPPSSSNFQLIDFGFGAGGTASSSSTNYLFQGILGEVETGSPSSANYISLPGLTYTLEPNVPNAPNFTNPSSYYNKLKIIIDNGANTSDTTFVIQLSTDNFTSDIAYVQPDNTLGGSPVFQTYTAWGGATGFNIVGLSPGTTYYARVAAKRGTFQQGQYSAVAAAATINATFTFNVQTSDQPTPPFTVGIGVVNPGQITTSWQKITTSISTNASNGGLVYIYGSNNGLRSASAGNYTISSSTNDLSSALEGYGAKATTVTQSAGGPMEIIAPYNGSGETVGVVDTNKRLFADSTSQPVTNGQATFELKAKASNTTPSATDYADVITLIGTGSF